MENNTKSHIPELLMVASTDLYNGIKRDYYPDITNSIENGNLAVCSIYNCRKKYNLSKHPNGDDADFYLWNPYSNTYMYMFDSDLSNKLITSKSIVIKEAFIRMGAKDVVLSGEAEQKQNRSATINNQADVKLSSARLDVNYNNDVLSKIKGSIESHIPDNKPFEFSKIENYIIGHGLSDDIHIMSLFDRLKSCDVLSGIERYELTYYSEMHKALNVAVNINCELFTDKFDLLYNNNLVQTIKKLLEVNFG